MVGFLRSRWLAFESWRPARLLQLQQPRNNKEKNIINLCEMATSNPANQATGEFDFLSVKKGDHQNFYVKLTLIEYITCAQKFETTFFTGIFWILFLYISKLRVYFSPSVLTFTLFEYLTVDSINQWRIIEMSWIYVFSQNLKIVKLHKIIKFILITHLLYFFNIWQLIQPMEDLSNLHNHNKQEVMFQVELKIMPKMFGDKFSRLVQDTPVSNTLERAHMEWWCKFWLF